MGRNLFNLAVYELNGGNAMADYEDWRQQVALSCSHRFPCGGSARLWLRLDDRPITKKQRKMISSSGVTIWRD